jgi:drug efflux transport system permease protein
MNGFWAMFRKELTQMLRDRATLFFALFVPVGELILFGVIDMNAKNIPTVVFDQSRTQESRALIRQFISTSLLDVVGQARSRDELQHAIVRGDAQVAIEIPPDYARNLAANRQADVLVAIDGSDSSIATQALNAANGVVLSGDIERLIAAARAPVSMVEAHPMMLFNPDMRSANLLIPGLIAILLTFSGTILCAFAIVKERERGTLEQLMVTPVSPLAVVLGKILPYLILAYCVLVVVLGIMVFAFRVPIHGSLTLLLSLSSVYLLALLSFGLLISSRSSTQMEAMQKSMGIMLPSVLLSGYIFPLSALPTPLRVIAHLLPATYFIQIARGIIIRGATFGDLWRPVASLVAISIVLIALSARAFQKTVS